MTNILVCELCWKAVRWLTKAQVNNAEAPQWDQVCAKWLNGSTCWWKKHHATRGRVMKRVLSLVVLVSVSHIHLGFMCDDDCFTEALMQMFSEKGNKFSPPLSQIVFCYLEM